MEYRMKQRCFLFLASLVAGSQVVLVNASGKECGALTGCFLRNLDSPEQGDLPLFQDQVASYTVGDHDSFSIRCDVEDGTSIDMMEFLYDDEVHTERSEPYWMRGDSSRGINRVRYLQECPDRKVVQVKGFVRGNDQPCFDVMFEIFAECDGFGITLNLIGVEDETLFTEASDRWSEVITGNLPPLVGFSDFATPIFGCNFPLDVDDLDICGLFQPIDGPFEVLAFAGPDFIRIPSFLPINGLMVFDSDDVGTTIAGDDLRNTILHEMGHVLGLGTLWEFLSIAGPDEEDCPYTGTQAFAEYQKISGCDAGFVPVELELGPGSRCGHWAEFCFDKELMTPIADIDSFNPLSQITAASLADLGYEISFDRVDHISSDDLSPDCRCDGHRRRGLTGWRQISRDKPRRKLQQETEAMAIEAGHAFMKRRKVDTSGFPDSVRFIGDKVVVVYVQQEGVIYDVLVTS